ncbi:MAG: undecaprenyl-diphosphate phosphatase [Synergistaceae bacterium]|jgi:undecaprenyl-diphosphatase|nr:undecaprenyl-diphosphate phosphatase [Synergistaceae bacterium]
MDFGTVSSGALILGLVQGVTEFLPVSSSGHLSLAKIIASFDNVPMAYDIVLHAATLMAVVIYFARDIVSILFEWFYGFVNANARRWAGWRFGWAVIVGTLVTAPFGILLKPLVTSAASDLLWLGVNFTVTGLLLLSSRFISEGDAAVDTRSGILIGLLQGIAVFPGISRSGATIWGGLVSGISRRDAFKFSFLLSVPAVTGAVLLELYDLGLPGFAASLPEGWIWGAAAAFCSGMISLILLAKLVLSDRLWVFSLYCFALGGFAIFYSLMGASFG